MVLHSGELLVPTTAKGNTKARSIPNHKVNVGRASSAHVGATEMMTAKVLVICSDPEMYRAVSLCIAVSWHSDNIEAIGMVQAMTGLPP